MIEIGLGVKTVWTAIVGETIFVATFILAWPSINRRFDFDMICTEIFRLVPKTYLEV